MSIGDTALHTQCGGRFLLRTFFTALNDFSVVIVVGLSFRLSAGSHITTPQEQISHNTRHLSSHLLRQWMKQGVFPRMMARTRNTRPRKMRQHRASLP